MVKRMESQMLCQSIVAAILAGLKLIGCEVTFFSRKGRADREVRFFNIARSHSK